MPIVQAKRRREVEEEVSNLLILFTGQKEYVCSSFSLSKRQRDVNLISKI